jgi:hypothetical protein
MARTSRFRRWKRKSARPTDPAVAKEGPSRKGTALSSFWILVVGGRGTHKIWLIDRCVTESLSDSFISCRRRIDDPRITSEKNPAVLDLMAQRSYKPASFAEGLVVGASLDAA